MVMCENCFLVRRIEESDINNVVSIHCASFQNFFLTQLGTDFLNVYYKAFSKSGKGVLLGCFNGEILVGFCAATFKSNGFNTGLIIDNFYSFVLQAFKLFFTNIKALIRLANNFRKVNQTVKDKGQYAELYSIAVSPLMQNSGIGKLLLNELESQLKQRKCNKLTLTTDYDNNNKTLQFYEKMGYNTMYEFITYPNRKMYRLFKDLQL